MIVLVSGIAKSRAKAKLKVELLQLEAKSLTENVLHNSKNKLFVVSRMAKIVGGEIKSEKLKKLCSLLCVK